MSTFLDLADALRDQIAAQPELAGIDVVVDRQKNIVVEISKALGKAKGAIVTILWTGGSVRNPKAKRLIFDSMFFVQVRSVPIINEAKGNAPADDLVEVVAQAMHHFVINPDGPNACRRRVEVMDVDLVPNEKQIIYEIAATANLVAN